MKQTVVKQTSVTRALRASALLALAVTMVIGVTALPAFAASDKQIAKASTLKESELPGTGWNAAPHKKNKDSTQPTCKPTNGANKAAEKYGAHSPDFDNTAGASVTNTVYVFPTVKDAKAYLATFKLPTALQCLQKSLDDNLTSAPGATATVSALDVTGGPVDDGVGYQGVLENVPTNSTPATTNLYLQAVAFRVGRAITGFTTSNPNEAYPDTVKLITAQVARLKKNLK